MTADLMESEKGHSLTDMIRDILADDDREGIEGYLGQAWLSQIVSALVAARRQAGLSQEDVAQRMNTKQPVVSRLENDSDGSCSLRRYLAYAHAVGRQPLDIVLEPLETVRVFAYEYPDAPRTQLACEFWRIAHQTQLAAHQQFLTTVSPYVNIPNSVAPSPLQLSTKLASNGVGQAPWLTLGPSFEGGLQQELLVGNTLAPHGSRTVEAKAHNTLLPAVGA